MFKSKCVVAPIAAVLSLTVAVPYAVAAQSYTVTDLVTYFGDAKYVSLKDINNIGVIAGMASKAPTYTDPTGSAYGFVYSNGLVYNITASLGYAFDGSINGINNNGDVVGSVRVPNLYNTIQPMVYSSSSDTVTTINPGGGGWSYAYSINDTGQVVGDARIPQIYYNHPFLYQNGTLTDLGTLGPEGWSSAHAINNLGQIAGQAASSNPDGGYTATHAFLNQDGGMLDLGTLSNRPGSSSYAWDINESGNIVGQADATTGSHAFLYKNGQMIDLDAFGSNLSSAGRINANNEVIGTYVKADGSSAPFYYSAQTGSITFDQLLGAASGWNITGVSGINDAGQMVGTALINGEYHPVLLTPVPEISRGQQFAIGLLALAGAAGVRRRQMIRN